LENVSAEKQRGRGTPEPNLDLLPHCHVTLITRRRDACRRIPNRFGVTNTVDEERGKELFFMQRVRASG
jgi:hypothetical protein